MGLNFAQNWPIYLLLGGFVVFVVFAVVNSRQQEKINKEAQSKEEKTPGKNKSNKS